MRKPGREFWRNLSITLVSGGAMYGFAIYIARQDRTRMNEIHKQSDEVYGKMRRAVDSVKHRKDTMYKSGSQQKYKIRDSGEGKDPYEDPDFDDLVPGEEYDEEFVDRSEGDPELYK